MPLGKKGLFMMFLLIFLEFFVFSSNVSNFDEN